MCAKPGLAASGLKVTATSVSPFALVQLGVMYKNLAGKKKRQVSVSLSDWSRIVLKSQPQIVVWKSWLEKFEIKVSGSKYAKFNVYCQLSHVATA